MISTERDSLLPMHTSFFLVAMLMTVVALVLAPLLRERLMVERRLDEMRRKLRALPAAPRDSTRVVVKVALDPKFKGSVGPDDTR